MTLLCPAQSQDAQFLADMLHIAWVSFPKFPKFVPVSYHPVYSLQKREKRTSVLFAGRNSIWQTPYPFCRGPALFDIYEVNIDQWCGHRIFSLQKDHCH
jgi:hypothetical protein